MKNAHGSKFLAALLSLALLVGLFQSSTLAIEIGPPYLLSLSYSYSDDGSGGAVNAYALEKALQRAKDLPTNVSSLVSDGEITLYIYQPVSEGNDAQTVSFDYTPYLFSVLEDGSSLLSCDGEEHSIDLTMDATTSLSLHYQKKETESHIESLAESNAHNAWFFIRTDGIIPIEDGGTSYPSNQYLPAHNKSNELSGLVTSDCAWTEYYGEIMEGDTLNGKKLSEAFASVLDVIPTQPDNNAIRAALASGNVTYDPETQDVIWYVVKTNGDGSPCPGTHVDGTLYTKGSSPTAVRILNYFKNIPDDNKLLAYSVHGLGTDAIVSSLTPTYEGHRFLGWSIAASDEISPTRHTSDFYHSGSRITMDEDLSLYAQWTPITYDVSYTWTGSVPADLTPPASTQVNYGESYTVDATFPAGLTCKADGGTYTFSGWNPTGIIDCVTAPVSIAGTWSFQEDPPPPSVYPVTYSWTGDVPNEVSLPETHSYPAGTKVALDLDPTVPDHYSFSGWSLPEDLVAEDRYFVMPAQAVSITGIWTYTAPDNGGGHISRFHVTVQYLEEETNQVLSPPYVSPSIPYGSHYDVSGPASYLLDGYRISKVDGAVSGVLRKDSTINVFYTPEATLPDEEPPLIPGPDQGGNDGLPPDVDTSPDESITPPPLPSIGDIDSSTNPPKEANRADGDIILIDGGIPLGNLPQTGTPAKTINQFIPLGVAALTLSLAVAVCSFKLLRKRSKKSGILP